MTKQLIFFFFLWIPFNLSAQRGEGSRFVALSSANAAMLDVWAIVANPAGIKTTANSEFSIHHEWIGISQSIKKQSFSGVLPFKRQTYGFALHRYGIPAFRTMELNIAANRQFGNLNIGFRANWHHLDLNTYGKMNFLSIDAGAILKISDAIQIGAYLNDLFPYLNSLKSNRYPAYSRVHMGITYRTSAQLLLSLSNNDKNMAFALEYGLLEKLWLRGGLQLKPLSHSAGIGFATRKMKIDFGIQNTIHFGFSPSLTLAHAF